MMDLTVLKLTTGETVIAELDNTQGDSNKTVYTKNPTLVFLTGDPNNPQATPQVQFMPYRTFGKHKTDDNVVPFKDQHIVVEYEPSDGLAQQYKELYAEVQLVQPSAEESNIILMDKDK